ncbi:MAG: polysaccharide biosynthesis tyrosine autokinase [Phycisphaerales bacterium]|nr:MAG: polysaccharide biosynthesis tyrosine autokinase [Phycisphaerales bacterium]
MTTAPAPRPPMPTPRPPAQGPSSTTGLQVTIDPVRLLKKYLWVFVAAGVIGVVLGVVGNIVLGRVAPVWRSTVIFQAFPPTTQIDQAMDGRTGNKDELERFMQTQAQVMTSPRVLETVVRNPRLLSEAPTWAEPYVAGDGNMDTRTAVRELSKDVRAAPMRGTEFIQLSMSYRDPAEATAIVGLVRGAYMSTFAQMSTTSRGEHQTSLQRLINEGRAQVRTLQTQRDQILVDEDIGTLDNRISESAQELQKIVENLASIRLNVEAIEDQIAGFEAQLRAPGGVTYSDSLRETVNRDQEIRAIRQRIDGLDQMIASTRGRGIGEGHRDILVLQSQRAAAQDMLESTRERRLRDGFDAQVDGARRGLSQLRAQEANLLERREDVNRRNNELTRLVRQISDLDSEIQRTQDSILDRENGLRNIQAISAGRFADRIQVFQQERIPDARAFPRLIVIGPLSVFLVLGLTTGVIVLREILDQRVKSASDITLIPRARVVGVIPDASEDPSAPKNIATVFRDQPRGVLAESFRQTRSPLLKKMRQAGHKSLLVVPGMPESGATTVASNLALTFAASDHRVLLIDANMRRPALHRVFERGDHPGLADVLAGEATLDAAAQITNDENLHLLACGTDRLRVFERLGTQAMRDLLADARTKYDVVLVDVAPAVVSGDAGSLSNLCDASVLVVRALSEKRGLVARLCNELNESQGEFLGVLVNGVRSAAGGYLKRNIQATHKYHAAES